MFICGFFTKLTDELVDEPFKVRFPKLQYATGIIYGLLAGYLVVNSPEFATLIIAISLGVLFAGKIDSKAHQFAIGGIFLFIAFAGIPQINFFLVVLFTALGFLDELLNDLIDRAKEKKVRVNELVAKFVNARLSLEIGTLAVGVITGNFVYFIALFVFDLAYNIVEKILPHFVERFDAAYGPQLALDLYKANSKKLANIAFVKGLLDNFPAKIGMKKISEPVVVEYNPENEKESGLSGFVIIAESHITIHTYPLKQLAKIDIVSCKEFDHKKAAELLKKAFNAKEAELQVLDRGKHYPSDVAKAKKLVEKERKGN